VAIPRNRSGFVCGVSHLILFHDTPEMVRPGGVHTNPGSSGPVHQAASDREMYAGWDTGGSLARQLSSIRELTADFQDFGEIKFIALLRGSNN
jgi:hypothetical protein